MDQEVVRKCGICRKRPARPNLKTCKNCVDQAIFRRDRLARKKKSLKDPIRTAQQLAHVLESQGYEISGFTEEYPEFDDDALVEIKPNIIVQIEWRRVATPSLSFGGPNGDLEYYVQTSTARSRRERNPSRDASIGIADRGHTYGVTIESTIPGRDRRTATHVGYYDDIQKLMTVLGALVPTQKALLEQHHS